jgi:hypothetical protein
MHDFMRQDADKFGWLELLHEHPVIEDRNPIGCHGVDLCGLDERETKQECPEER